MKQLQRAQARRVEGCDKVGYDIWVPGQGILERKKRSREVVRACKT